MTVIDATESDFQREVIDRSHTTPVVVDFWAPWCGPCKQLTPLLEQLAGDAEGMVVLAKVNTDDNQALSQTYGVQGIPSVKAFVDGKIVDEFVGAQSPATVQRFFAKLIPSEADGLVASGTRRSCVKRSSSSPGARTHPSRWPHCSTRAASRPRRLRCSSASAARSAPTAWPPGCACRTTPSSTSARR